MDGRMRNIVYLPIYSPMQFFDESQFKLLQVKLHRSISNPYTYVSRPTVVITTSRATLTTVQHLQNIRNPQATNGITGNFISVGNVLPKYDTYQHNTILHA